MKMLVRHRELRNDAFAALTSSVRDAAIRATPRFERRVRCTTLCIGRLGCARVSAIEASGDRISALRKFCCSRISDSDGRVVGEGCAVTTEVDSEGLK